MEICITVDEKFRQFIDGCEILNGYYIASRYPIDMPKDYFREQVEEAFEIVKEITEFIQSYDNI